MPNPCNSQGCGIRVLMAVSTAIQSKASLVHFYKVCLFLGRIFTLLKTSIMKQLLMFLMSVLFSAFAFGQMNQIRIVSFQVKNTLPAKIDEWTSTPGALILTAQKMPNTRLKEVKLVLQIRSNGAIVCGNNYSTAQLMPPFEVRTITTNELTSMLGNCKELKEGSYQICAQYFNIDKLAISEEVCREFKVESSKPEDFAPPTLINPDNGKVFTPEDMKKPLQFRWTPLVPKPRDPVTYRLKVWQLMQGQNGTAAMRANTPVIEKDVREITQAIVNNIYTGPCRPPYLCDFVWTVQALGRDDKPLGRNNGMSDVFSFSVSSCQFDHKIFVDSVRCVKTEGANSIYKICIRSQYQSALHNLQYGGPSTGVLAYVGMTPYPISGLTPALTPQNSGAMTTVTYCFNITVPTGTPTVDIGIQGNDVDPGPFVCQPGVSTKVTLPPCACDFCKEPNFILNTPLPSSINYGSNQLSFNQTLGVLTMPSKPIKSIAAELVYFEMKPENDFCLPCNKDAATYGHFANGTNSMYQTGPTTSLPIVVTTPQLTPCCGATFRWCIRYKIEFMDCTTCSKVVCYEKKKEGCTNAPNSNPDILIQNSKN